MEKDTRSSLEKFGTWLKGVDPIGKAYDGLQGAMADIYYRVIMESWYGRHGNGERYFKGNDTGRDADAGDIKIESPDWKTDAEYESWLTERQAEYDQDNHLGPEEDEGMEM